MADELIDGSDTGRGERAMAMAVTVRDLASVFKLRIGFAITLSALGGLAVTEGTLPDGPAIAALALAVFLASASAGAFNQFVERDLDARMPRTRNRPFVAGRFRAGAGWLAAILLLLAAAVLLAAQVANGWAALYVFLGAATYGVVYTVWLKRRTWLNIVVGGLSGSFAVLAGAAAVDPAIGVTPLLLAIVLFLWTPPHFWSLSMALREDYAEAGVPMLPVVVGNPLCAKVVFAHTLTLSVLALLPALAGMGRIYLFAALAGGIWFTLESWWLVMRPTRRQAMRNFFASLGQLLLLLLGAIADRWLSGAG